jgi:protein-S-isoprenylcysteine O-methyltransferase Ste14
MLVVLQFSAILAIVLVCPFPRTLSALAVLTAGSALGIASIITMKLDNLRIFPEPKQDIRLVTSGPYRFIRHPMYTSVLLMMISFVVQAPSLETIILWLLLLTVLLAKIRIEERLIPLHFPEYILYQQRTWKLIPLIY